MLFDYNHGDKHHSEPEYHAPHAPEYHAAPEYDSYEAPKPVKIEYTKKPAVPVYKPVPVYKRPY